MTLVMDVSIIQNPLFTKKEREAKDRIYQSIAHSEKKKEKTKGDRDSSLKGDNESRSEESVVVFTVC